MRYPKLLMAFMWFMFAMSCAAPMPGDTDPGLLPDQSAERVGQQTQAAGTRSVPFIRTRVDQVFNPSGGRYLNDHTIIRGTDNVFHLYGITNTGTGNPWGEVSFLHATATTITGPWTEQADALTATPTEGLIWAPHVVQISSSPLKYWMVYTTNEGLNRVAESTDLWTWTRISQTIPGGRDAHLVKIGSTWYCYSVGTNGSGNGTIQVTTSTNLTSWSATSTVITDPDWIYGWGNLESPVLVSRTEGYYLFVTRVGPQGQNDSGANTHDAGYMRTLVFYNATSPTSFNWTSGANGELHAHAGEVVTVGTTQYLTSAGWPYERSWFYNGLSLGVMKWGTY